MQHHEPLLHVRENQAPSDQPQPKGAETAHALDGAHEEKQNGGQTCAGYDSDDLPRHIAPPARVPQAWPWPRRASENDRL
jgi:hypothetical protein